MTYKFSETPRVMIVEARYYEDIGEALLKGTRTVLDEAGCEYDRFEVPGALEIPAMIKFAIRSLTHNIQMQRYDAYIALGCVIRGETSHYDIVAGESAAGLLQLASQYSLALGNGILTVENREQAIVRSDPGQKNKGGEAARAALKMLGHKQNFGLFPRTTR